MKSALTFSRKTPSLDVLFQSDRGQRQKTHQRGASSWRRTMGTPACDPRPLPRAHLWPHAAAVAGVPSWETGDVVCTWRSCVGDGRRGAWTVTAAVGPPPPPGQPLQWGWHPATGCAWPHPSVRAYVETRRRPRRVRLISLLRLCLPCSAFASLAPLVAPLLRLLLRDTLLPPIFAPLPAPSPLLPPFTRFLHGKGR